MKRLAYLGISLALVCQPVNAQDISQRVTPMDGAPNHGDWLLPAGIGAGVIHHRLNNGEPAARPTRIENWDITKENRHWVFTGGEDQCRKMGRKHGFGRLIKFVPGKNPGEGMCIFEGKQRSFN